MAWTTVSDSIAGISKKTYSATETIARFLERIAVVNPKINAYLAVRDDVALAQAKVSDERIAKGTARALEGVPLAVKDNMMMKGERTTAGSHILESYKATYTATVIKKLEDAGAIILGKTNLDEFAMGSSTEFSAFGPTKNPHDVTRVPGGSSGGSAVAVSADLCAASLGSDTGGSIRQPASFCGVVGFKPTYGRVSRYGLIAMSSSLDQIGPFAKTVQDAGIIYNIIAGEDTRDATSSIKKITIPEVQEKNFLKGKKFGIPKSFLKYTIDEAVQTAFDATVEKLKQAGAEIVEVDIPLARMSLAVYYLMVTSEISSNLARYDGIRYGTRAKADDLLEQYLQARTAGFGEEAKRRILLGTFTLSKGYRDKYYGQALHVREAIKKQFDFALGSVDALISPTSPTCAFALGEKYENPLTMYLSDLFTVSANIANLPAISLPIPTQNLPIGFQLMGARFGDTGLLELASACENLIGKTTPATIS